MSALTPKADTRRERGHVPLIKADAARAFRLGHQTRNHFQIELAPRLNNRSLALADRCFAFTPASGKADGENYRANCNQEFFHDVTPRSKNHKEVSLFFHLQLVQKGHTVDANF